MEINEAKLKDILTGQREEYQRHLDAAIEDFQSQVKLIAEQYNSIIQKLDIHEVGLLNMEKNIEIIKVDIEFIKGGLRRKVDLEEFETLEKRVTILESKM